ncbi:unnamed protein product, partial [Adineta steineri]
MVRAVFDTRAGQGMNPCSPPPPSPSPSI